MDPPGHGLSAAVDISPLFSVHPLIQAMYLSSASCKGDAEETAPEGTLLLFPSASQHRMFGSTWYP
jgi:hypothetical protein